MAERLAGNGDALRGKVRVGVQADTAVTLPGCTHRVTQVYCSAMPIAYAPAPLPEWEPFARLVLQAAYLATFALAWRQARTGGSRRLFLTRLGGGAFGNPPGWISEAIQMALDRFSGCDLDVAIVSYGGADPANRPLLRR